MKPTSNTRQLSWYDPFLIEIDSALRSLLKPDHRVGTRSSPADAFEDASLSPAEQRQVIGFTRVNHAGEICAQALYRGQALTAQDELIHAQMMEAADEERDHLAWCEQRLDELGGKTSVLNGMWYMGSFLLGAVAGLVGDRWSLGFVAETERQVQAHLQGYLARLPTQDHKTKAIFETMEAEEAVHANTARVAGAATLPEPIKRAMHGMSRLLTYASYYM